MKIPVFGISFFSTFKGQKKYQTALTIFQIVLQFKNECFYWVMGFTVSAALTLCITPGSGTNFRMRFSELTAEAPPRVCGVADSMKVSPSKPNNGKYCTFYYSYYECNSSKIANILLSLHFHKGLFDAIQTPENVLSKISTSHWNESTVWHIQLYQLDFFPCRKRLQLQVSPLLSTHLHC